MPQEADGHCLAQMRIAMVRKKVVVGSAPVGLGMPKLDWRVGLQPLWLGQVGLRWLRLNGRLGLPMLKPEDPLDVPLVLLKLLHSVRAKTAELRYSP